MSFKKFMPLTIPKSDKGKNIPYRNVRLITSPLATDLASYKLHRSLSTTAAVNESIYCKSVT